MLSQVFNFRSSINLNFPFCGMQRSHSKLDKCALSVGEMLERIDRKVQDFDDTYPHPFLPSSATRDLKLIVKSIPSSSILSGE